MDQRKKSTKIAIFSLLFGGAFVTWQTASAGPITNGPGVAPFVKLGVYQGVISVVPGGATDSILEIGNAGRDIASTGAIYLRPGTSGGQSGSIVISSQDGTNEGAELNLRGSAAYQQWNLDVLQNRFRIHTNGAERFVIDGTAGNIYVPSGSICYGNVGSTNCLTVGGGPGTTPTLDAVLGAGNTGNAKTILLNNMPPNAQAFGATSGASLGVGSFAFLMPQAAGNGSYSDVTRQNDSGLLFNSATGLTISGWNAGGTIKGMRVSGGNVLNAAVSANNGLAGVGGSGDTLATYANTSGSALYAQQNGVSATSYAGYFSGRVNITGDLIYKGRLKPTPGLQVCEISTDTCLGRYLFSSGTIRDDGASGVRYHYDSGSAITSVLVYVGTPSPTCPAGWTLIQRGIGVHQSLYTTAGCSGGISTEYVNPGSNPYGNPADPQVCRQNTSVTRTIVGYRDSFTGGACVATNSTISVQALSATTPGTSYSPRYELR